jgi:hypothetical protein
MEINAMSERQTTWNGRPPQDNPAGWHLLRRRVKGFPRDGEEVPWLYTPGLCSGQQAGQVRATLCARPADRQ